MSWVQIPVRTASLSSEKSPLKLTCTVLPFKLIMANTWKIRKGGYGGRGRTAQLIAFSLCTQRPRVRLSAFPKNYSLNVADFN